MTTPIRCGYVDTSWGQVHYRSAGNAGPWVGLFHESPLSSRVYEDVLVQLAPHCRAVAFDTPGYGSSALPPSATEEIPDYAEVLGQAAVAVGMKDAVFGGVHTGASIAIELAHDTAGLHYAVKPQNCSGCAPSACASNRPNCAGCQRHLTPTIRTVTFCAANR